MAKLIYCAYNLIDQDVIPDWVSKFVANPVVVAERWAIYNPIDGFTTNFERNLGIAAALADARLSSAAVENQVALKLDPMLLEPLDKAMPRLKAADRAPVLDVAFRNLYVLMRADVVLADLDMLGHGEASQEVMYAYLCNVPVVGIAHRFMLSPWVVNKVKAVIFPRTTDEIVQQVLAYDHKTTAMIDCYRQERIEQDRKAEEKAKANRRTNRALRLQTQRGEATTGKPVSSSESSSESEAETGAAAEQTDGSESGSSPI